MQPQPALQAPIPKLDGINGLSIPAQDVRVLRKVGSGKFSDVYETLVYGCRAAVKVPRPESAALRDAYLELFRQEAHHLSTVIHHNVGRIFGFVFVQNPTHPQDRGEIWLEYLEGGTMQALLDSGLMAKTGHPLSLYVRMKIARDIVKGMIFVHKHCLCHHDLKPDNIMFDEHGVVKVVDFGYAEKIAPGEMIRSGQLKGSPLWMAPEVMGLGQYNQKSDVYSWALLCWQLLTRSAYPFPHEGVPWKVFREAVVVQSLRPQIPPNCIPSLRYLLLNAWHPNPDKRPSFIDIDSLFDGILLECAVQDEYARRFWTGAFGTPLQERVTWDEFVPRFFSFLQLPPPDLTRPRRRDIRVSPLHPSSPSDPSGTAPDLRGVPASQLEQLALSTPVMAPAVKAEMDRREGNLWAAALKELLCPKYSPVALERDMVTLERFGKITQQFGPILFNSIQVFFQGIRAVLQKPWYKGDLTREQTHRVLNGKDVGTFLVRMSAHPDHACVMSVVTGQNGAGSIAHYVILQQPGQGFCLDLDVQLRIFFPNLTLLVDHYTKLGLLKETCHFDWRDLSVAVTEDEPLDDDYVWNLDQYAKSFVKQIAEAQGVSTVKRRLEDATADSDYLKWTVFAASMSPPPRVDGSAQPGLAEHWQRLEQRLELYHLTFRRQAPNDASCQFVALADQLHGKVEKAADVRAMVAAWLRQNGNLVVGEGRTLTSLVSAASWEAYTAWMASASAWGDHVSLFAAAQLFQVHIRLVSSIPGAHFVIAIPPLAAPQTERAIWLAHWGDSFYGSLSATEAAPKRQRPADPAHPAHASSGSAGDARVV